MRLTRLFQDITLVVFSLVLATTFAVASPDNRTVPTPPIKWESTLLTDHPLVGKIWSTKAQKFVSAQDMGTDMALARFILLGEIHDNPDHHLWQAWAIRTISKLRGARLVEGAPQADFIAMEMLSVDQYEGIDKFYGRNAHVPRKRKPGAFGRMVGWKKSGWPDFKIYEPIVAQAMYEQLALVPASPTRETNRRVSKQGLLSALGGPELQRLALASGLPAEAQKTLLKEIEDSHCGLMPAKHFPRMAEVQRFRDATMADALISAGDYKGAILIAGNGHVRKDRAVPHYLNARGITPEAVRVLAIMEVTDGKEDAASYLPTFADGQPAVDYVVFTPRVDREDPCEVMKKQFEQMRQMKSKKPATTETAPPK